MTRFRMKKSFILKSVFVLVVTVISSSFAGNQTETYTIGVENIQYLPHYTTDDSGYHGFAREILDLFAHYADVRFDYRTLPVNRLFLELVEKQIDFKYPDNPRWHADTKKGHVVVYSDTVEEYIAGAVVRPERKGLGVKNLEALGAVLGFTPLPFMDFIKAGKMKLHQNRHFDSLLQQAILGRIDAVYLDINVASYQLREILKQPDALVFDPSLPYSKSFFTLSTIKHPELINVFNRFLAEKDLQIKELKKRHLITTDFSAY